MADRLGVLVIGCGLIGRRRAEAASNYSRTKLVAVCDANASAAETFAREYGVAGTASWRQAVLDPAVAIVCVATPNAYLQPISTAALGAGKHVLLEKPMGRNLAEAFAIEAAAERAQKLVKIGFNHRYHPAIAEAHRRTLAGDIGQIISIRARYGHGGRPGYEKEWRGNAELAGGGELTDQGVHIVDLVNWFAGVPDDAFCYLQTAVWPLQPLEDNGFGLFRYQTGAVVSMHTSWTQWKNLFSFEIYGVGGSLSIDGLGKTYGTERLVVTKRSPLGGAPAIEEIVYDQPDFSWEHEWADFISAIETGTPYLGTGKDGVAAMAMIDALYRSAHSGQQVAVRSGCPAALGG